MSKTSTLILLYIMATSCLSHNGRLFSGNTSRGIYRYNVSVNFLETKTALKLTGSLIKQICCLICKIILKKKLMNNVSICKYTLVMLIFACVKSGHILIVCLQQWPMYYHDFLIKTETVEMFSEFMDPYTR